MDFKKGLINVQAAGYNGARKFDSSNSTLLKIVPKSTYKNNLTLNCPTSHRQPKSHILFS